MTIDNQVTEDIQKLEADAKATIANDVNKVKAEVFSIEAFLKSKLALITFKPAIAFIKKYYVGLLQLAGYLSIIALLVLPSNRNVSVKPVIKHHKVHKTCTSTKVCTIKEHVGK